MTAERFMEFLRIIGQQSANDTNTTFMIQTPTSKTEAMAMLIHQIDYQYDDHSKVDHSQAMVIVDRDVGAIGKWITDQECIDAVRYKQKFTTTGLAYLNVIQKHTFDPPILYSRAAIGMQIRSTTTGAQKWGRVRIGYTLEKVSKMAFIEALTE